VIADCTWAHAKNWYRNSDRNRELTAPVAERRSEQPALFRTGERDPVRRFMPAEAMRGGVSDLRAEIVVPGAATGSASTAPLGGPQRPRVLRWTRSQSG
jgi:hypothetical protein